MVTTTCSALAQPDVGAHDMATTTKRELIDRIAAETNQNRATVKLTVQSFLDNVIKELGDGNRLEFRDFGVFEVKERAPRVAQNPKTMEPVPVPAKKTVKFKIGRLMKQQIEPEVEPVVAVNGTSRRRTKKAAR